MSEKPRKKADDIPAWLDSCVHVWRNKSGDLTVVNLREPSESMKLSAGGMKVAASTATPPPVKLGQSDSVNALLARIHSNQQANDLDSPTELLRMYQKPSLSTPLTTAEARIRVSTSSQQQESHNPVFPEPTNSTANNFEFISGTNIPGRGLVSDGKREHGTQCLALFHDPLWGDSSNTWMPSSQSQEKEKKEPKTRTFFATSDDAKGAQGAPLPQNTPMYVPSATPPFPSSGPSGVHPLVGGMTTLPMGAAHTAMSTGGYAMYGIQIPFLPTVQPTYTPANIVQLNPFHYYQVGGASSIPLHPMQAKKAPPPPPPPPATVVPMNTYNKMLPSRSGINVEATPFIPGGGKRL
ncbi:unnamed protein product [Phytomonas sp. EM1]|nr:unnamed protein product [Phytomonas sp. EM1]|eukprot:CCW61493.1 unnamed protein product [Phytomonas sp. isolate EM1]